MRRAGLVLIIIGCALTLIIALIAFFGGLWDLKGSEGLEREIANIVIAVAVLELILALGIILTITIGLGLSEKVQQFVTLGLAVLATIGATVFWFTLYSWDIEVTSTLSKYQGALYYCGTFVVLQLTFVVTGGLLSLASSTQQSGQSRPTSP